MQYQEARKKNTEEVSDISFDWDGVLIFVLVAVILLFLLGEVIHP